MSSQDSGAQRRLCWMQGRLRRKSGASTAIRPYLGLFDGRCRAAFAWGVQIVRLGRVGSPQRTQTSGAQRRLGGACESQTRAAPAYALRVSVLASRRKYGTPAARRPYQTFSKSAALLCVIGKFGIATRANNTDFTLARQPWQ